MDYPRVMNLRWIMKTMDFGQITPSIKAGSKHHLAIKS